MKQQIHQEGMFLFWYMTIFIYCSLTICKHGCEVWKMFWQHGVTNAAIANVTQKLPQIPVIQDFFPSFFYNKLLSTARFFPGAFAACDLNICFLISHFSVVINGKYCCPKIYFNHRCFSGPYLNKGRIAELPQSVGPGNCVLVLKEVSWMGRVGLQNQCIINTKVSL